MENNKEFKIDDIVTIDRYNRKGDESKGKVVGYGQMPISRTLTYKVVVDGLEIQTTGASIVESKNYQPVSDNERHGYVSNIS